MNQFTKSIVFKGFLFFLLFAIVFSVSMIGTVLLVGKKDLEEHTFNRLVLTGEVMVKDLRSIRKSVEANVRILARVASHFGTPDEKDRKIVKSILDYPRVEGGGVWPLPYRYDPKKKHATIFFARSKPGAPLKFNNSYNVEGGIAYYDEPWFNIARSMPLNTVKWSKVYTDPYTKVQMITASSPINKDGEFWGVATVDIGLYYIDPMLDEISHRIEGYAFLLDGSDRVIATTQKGVEPGEAFSQIVRDFPSFESVDQLLKSMNAPYRKNTNVQKSFVLEEDPFIGSKSFGIVYRNSSTNWKLGMVVPYESAFEQGRALLEKLAVISLLITFFIILFGYVVIRRLVIRPVRKIVKHLEKEEGKKIEKLTPVPLKQEGEIGVLVKVLNKRTEMLKESYLELDRFHTEARETLEEILFTMGTIGEIRSEETSNHVRRVAGYSELLAHYYGLPPKECTLVKEASPLHDIGKAALPDAVIRKSGRFTEAERRLMNDHTRLGYEMLMHSERPLFKAAAIIAYEHHERYDGKGYPRGLQGSDIHIYGRITALADVFDALGSDREYKKAWRDDEIWAYFREQSGKQFDPELVELFFNHLDAFLKIRDTYRDEPSRKDDDLKDF